MTDAERTAWLRAHYPDAGVFLRDAIDAAMFGLQLVVPPPEPKLSAVLAAVQRVQQEIINMGDTLEAGLGEIRAEVDMMKGAVSGIGTIMSDLHTKLEAALAGMTAGSATSQGTIDEVHAIVTDLKANNAALAALAMPASAAEPAAPAAAPDATPPAAPAPAPDAPPAP